MLSSRFPRVGPGDIVTLLSVPSISGRLGFEVNLACVMEMRTNVYFISILGEGHGL